MICRILLCFFSLVLLALPCLANAKQPQIKAALLINLKNNSTLYAKNENTAIAPASLTKIMTMFLVLDAVRAKKISLNSKVRITKKMAGVGGSAMHLSAGETVSVARLLAGAAVASGNDAAMALAAIAGGSINNFVVKMNKKAAKLGMKKTVFKNPTGLPQAGQKTTAYDLSLLCKAYLAKHPQAMRFHGMKFLMHKGAAIHNTNPLLGTIKGVTGLKTGWTVASGYNLIATAKRGKTNLLVVILGAKSKKARESAAINLLNAGFKYPENKKGVKKILNWN